jgi:hypothetical protein
LGPTGLFDATIYPSGDEDWYRVACEGTFGVSTTPDPYTGDIALVDAYVNGVLVNVNGPPTSGAPAPALTMSSRFT